MNIIYLQEESAGEPDYEKALHEVDQKSVQRKLRKQKTEGNGEMVDHIDLSQNASDEEIPSHATRTSAIPRQIKGTNKVFKTTKTTPKTREGTFLSNVFSILKAGRQEMNGAPSVLSFIKNERQKLISCASRQVKPFTNFHIAHKTSLASHTCPHQPTDSPALLPVGSYLLPSTSRAPPLPFTSRTSPTPSISRASSRPLIHMLEAEEMRPQSQELSQETQEWELDFLDF